jgi:hypothetical protein
VSEIFWIPLLGRNSEQGGGKSGDRRDVGLA